MGRNTLCQFSNLSILELNHQFGGNLITPNRSDSPNDQIKSSRLWSVENIGVILGIRFEFPIESKFE